MTTDTLNVTNYPNGISVAAKGAGKVSAGSILSGTGTPESAVTAPVGSLFLRTDGGSATTLYVKTSGTGNTGWGAVTAS